MWCEFKFTKKCKPNFKDVRHIDLACPCGVAMLETSINNYACSDISFWGCSRDIGLNTLPSSILWCVLQSSRSWFLILPNLIVEIHVVKHFQNIISVPCCATKLPPCHKICCSCHSDCAANVIQQGPGGYQAKTMNSYSQRPEFSF